MTSTLTLSQRARRDILPTLSPWTGTFVPRSIVVSWCRTLNSLAPLPAAAPSSVFDHLQSAAHVLLLTLETTIFDHDAREDEFSTTDEALKSGIAHVEKGDLLRVAITPAQVDTFKKMMKTALPYLAERIQNKARNKTQEAELTQAGRVVHDLMHLFCDLTIDRSSIIQFTMENLMRQYGWQAMQDDQKSQQDFQTVEAPHAFDWIGLMQSTALEEQASDLVELGQVLTALVQHGETEIELPSERRFNNEYNDRHQDAPTHDWPRRSLGERSNREMGRRQRGRFVPAARRAAVARVLEQ